MNLSTTDPSTPGTNRIGEVFAAFAKLGLISFGGPVAHIGYFHEEFVVRRRWLDEAAFADLMALCQFLPGPASSQMVFALGLRRAGIVGGIVASLCFTLPSALAMILFALGVSSLGDLRDAGWLHGLKVAAVAVVAQAVWAMATKLCPDRTRVTLALLAAIGVLLWSGAPGQVCAILGGGIVGWFLYHREIQSPAKPTPHSDIRGHVPATAALALFFLLLVGLPILVKLSGSTALAMFDSFYRSGSLVFGGGHVVLPLLRAEVVPPGWVGDQTFLAGYGAAQALPGPLFTFAAYLGAAMTPEPNGWLGGFWCLLAIFLPALLLVGGALPFWERLRTFPAAQAALRGTSAAVVGILLAALYNPVWIEGVTGPTHFCLALAAFGSLVWWKIPPWLVVIAAAALGEWLL